ncbi:hypothetical protein WJX77_001729 [Trebouxia sp. C0004]
MAPSLLYTRLAIPVFAWPAPNYSCLVLCTRESVGGTSLWLRGLSDDLSTKLFLKLDTTCCSTICNAAVVLGNQEARLANSQTAQQPVCRLCMHTGAQGRYCCHLLRTGQSSWLVSLWKRIKRCAHFCWRHHQGSMANIVVEFHDGTRVAVQLLANPRRTAAKVQNTCAKGFQTGVGTLSPKDNPTLLLDDEDAVPGGVTYIFTPVVGSQDVHQGHLQTVVVDKTARKMKSHLQALWICSCGISGGEDKTSEAELEKALEELSTKLKEWGAAVHGKVEYLLCYACAGSQFQMSHRNYHLQQDLEPVGQPVVSKHFDQRPQSSGELKKSIRCILHALEVLHQAGFAHTDLRWENIILQHAGQWVLIDLEFACELDSVPFTPVGHTRKVTAWRYLLFAKLEILPALPKAKLHLSIAVSGKCHLPPCFNFAPGAAARLDAELAKLIRGLGNCRSEDSLAHFASRARRGVIMNEVYINQEAEPCVLEVDETLDLVGLNLQPANIVTNSKRGLVDSQSGQTKRRFADIQQDVLRDGLAGSKTHPLQISGAPIAGAWDSILPEAPDEEGPGPSKKNKTGQLSGAPLIEQSKPLVKRAESTSDSCVLSADASPSRASATSSTNNDAASAVRVEVMGNKLDLRNGEDRLNFLLSLVQAYRLLAVMSATVPQLPGRWPLYSEIIRENSIILMEGMAML